MATLFDGIGANGFSTGFAMGNQIRKQRGLASGFSNYLNATDDAGRNAALQQMAEADPVATMGFINDQERLRNQEKQIGMMSPYQQAMLDIENKKLGALQEKKLQEEALKQEEEAKSLSNAQSGVNTMKEVADSGNLTRFQDSWWNKWDKDIQADQGKLASAIAAVAPRAISKLKAAGVSGVNTLGEFMTYVGLPQNATDKQIAAAVPLIAEIIGVENPYSSRQNDGIAQTINGSKVNADVFSNVSDEDLIRGL